MPCAGACATARASLQVDGVLWRFKYSRAEFAVQLAAWSGGDAFYEAKARSIYEGKDRTNHMSSMNHQSHKHHKSIFATIRL